MSLRVALAHDWLTNQGGGERVLWQLHLIYPEAPIYTSVFNAEKLPEFTKLDIRTSYLQRWPIAARKHQLFPTLRTTAFESFDFRGYDLVISSSSAEAKGLITPPGTMHISYIHTPTRYYWSGYQDYLRHPGFGKLSPIVRLVMPRQVTKLRAWDFAAAQRPDHLIANSKYIQARINKYYRRDSKVIYPPVDLDRFRSQTKREDYYLVVSRLIPYKQIELAIQACNRMKRQLIVVGDGSQMPRLKQLAGPNVRFLGRLSDSETARLYSSAKALIFTAEEDFGITPLEAMASGCPVIAYGRGGALESVVSGETGVFFREPSVDSLLQAMKKFEALEFDQAVLGHRAEVFSNQNFRQQIKQFVEEKLSLED